MHKSFLMFIAIAAMFTPQCRGENVDSSQTDKPVLLYIDSFVDSATDESFSSQFTEAIGEALLQIQLSVIRIDSFGGNQKYHARTDVPTLYVTAGQTHTASEERDSSSLIVKPVQIVVGVVNTPQPNEEDLALATRHPLVSMPWTEENRYNFIPIMVRKVVENLRAGYLSYLVVESLPENVLVLSGNGLKGYTPVEWVFTPTTATIEARKDGYLPFTTKVDIQNPGSHKLHIQLTRRRFYHSRLMFGVLGFGAVALAGYAACNYYYDQYQALGESDYYDNPEKFAETFDRARQCERVAGVGLGIASTFFLLSFWF